MKYLILFLLSFLLLSCASSKKITTSTTIKDSVTTITARPVTLTVPADSVKNDFILNTFSLALQKTKGGGEVMRKQHKGISFKIIKSTSDSVGFSIVALTLPKDSTVFVYDTLRKVTNTTKVQVVEEKKTLFEKVKEFTFLLLLILFFLFLLFRKLL